MTSNISATLLDAALMHVPFDGWSETTFRAAVADTGVDPTVARALFPRGAVDLALTYHRNGDTAMVDRLNDTDLSPLRYSERVALAVRYRLDAVEDKEAVRRGTTLFSLPMYAADGARAIWGTADAIWTALGDTSDDVNWYTKRASLSAVYSSTVLFWLGDDSPGHTATWDFLDRRIDDVMRFEKAKGQMRKMPGLGLLMKGADQMLSGIHAPRKSNAASLPGQSNFPS